jgi:hypothetical protein
MLGSFLPPAPTPSLTTHSAPSLSPLPPQDLAEMISAGQKLFQQGFLMSDFALQGECDSQLCHCGLAQRVG